jgi:hypothetical protein
MASPTFQIEDDYRRSDVGPRKRSPWVGCLVGCLVVLGIAVLLAVLAAVWIYRNSRDLFAGMITLGVKQTVEESDLPLEEKAQVKAEIDRAAKAFGDGQLTGEQAAELVQLFVESPLMATIVSSAAEQAHIDKSGLSDEEKAEARVTLRRFLRGAIDGSIDRPTVEVTLSRIGNRQPNNIWRLRSSVSDEDLRKFLEDAKQAADEANVPQDPGTFDPSEEVKRIIDAAIAGQAINGPGMDGPVDVPPMEAPPED